MKKQILMACGVLISALGLAQGKFYTNNFSKEVNELNLSMKTVGFTTVLPSDYAKYDDIVAVVDRKDEGLNDYYELSFYFNIMPTTQVPSGGKMKYVLHTGSDKRTDFSSLMRRDLDVDFDLFLGAKYKARTTRYQTVVVKVMGRTKIGMHWVNEEFVPKWNYEKLSFTEIKLDLGEPEPTYTTEDGLITYEKYTDGKTFTSIYPNDQTKNFRVIYEHGEDFSSKITFSIYEIEAGKVKQQVVEMGAPAPKAASGTSVADMKKEIKLNLKKSLVKASCYNEARSVKLSGQRIAEPVGIYAPYMMDTDAKKSNAGSNALGSLKSIGGQFVKPKKGSDKYNKFVNSAESDLNWEQKMLGNQSFEFLELDLYRHNQCKGGSSTKSKALKDGEEGKTQKLILFMGEVDGKLYVGSFTKDGDEEMNAEDLKFKDFVLSTFKIN